MVLNYANPSSRDSNGNCCDNLLSCINECDTHLEFCFRPPGFSSALADEDCPLRKLTAGEVGGDSITFGSTVGELSNPFTVQVQDRWLVSSANFCQVTQSIEPAMPKSERSSALVYKSIRTACNMLIQCFLLVHSVAKHNHVCKLMCTGLISSLGRSL